MEDNFSNIKERVLYLSELKNITKEFFFSKIGMTYGSFKGSAKERPLNSDAIVNILTLFPDVRAEWLLTGKGAPTKNESELVKNPQPLDFLQRFEELVGENALLKKEITELKARLGDQ